MIVPLSWHYTNLWCNSGIVPSYRRLNAAPCPPTAMRASPVEKDTGLADGWAVEVTGSKKMASSSKSKPPARKSKTETPQGRTKIFPWYNLIDPACKWHEHDNFKARGANQRDQAVPRKGWPRPGEAALPLWTWLRNRECWAWQCCSRSLSVLRWVRLGTWRAIIFSLKLTRMIGYWQRTSMIGYAHQPPYLFQCIQPMLVPWGHHISVLSGRGGGLTTEDTQELIDSLPQLAKKSAYKKKGVITNGQPVFCDMYSHGWIKYKTFRSPLQASLCPHLPLVHLLLWRGRSLSMRMMTAILGRRRRTRMSLTNPALR